MTGTIQGRRLSVIVCFMLLAGVSLAQSPSRVAWTFAVSGDSRNCGDVIMPAIAEAVKSDHSQFFWHLGDYRAIYDFDQDYRQIHPRAAILTYEQDAWPDFIEHQLEPFGNVPVYLSLGNHETIPPKTRGEAFQTFADWFDDSVIRAQRLADNPRNHKVETYYHWIKPPVDFITLDNASDDMFDDGQILWFEGELQNATRNTEVRTVVVGMHEALPDSLSTGHSMNESQQGVISGRRIYKELVDFRNKTGKNVYIVASHSHFYMANIYNTACRRLHPDSILPGWVIGTAGAVRYQLPKDLTGADAAQNDLYGYLSGQVLQDGTIRFQFRPIEKTLSAIPDSVRREFSDAFVQSCLNENHSKYQVEGPLQPPACPE